MAKTVNLTAVEKLSTYNEHTNLIVEQEGELNRVAIADCLHQHVQGKYNIIDDEDKYCHIVGNGTNDENRSNAHTIDWNGDAWFQGDVYIGSTSGKNKDSGSEKLATETRVIELINNALGVIENGAY